MKVIFSVLAGQELDDASDYYEQELEGLGSIFRYEVKSAIARIVAHPQAWSAERNGFRKCLMHKFPYKILYSMEPDHMLIIAIAHQHRKPNYWVEKI